MSDSLQRQLRAGLLAVACSTALVLGACGGDDSSPAPTTGSAATTTTALAVSQIDAQTCDNNDAQDVNGLTVNDDQDETDVTMLSPGCSAH